MTIKFREAVCQNLGCSPQEFEKLVFWRCLYRHALPVARALWITFPHFFDDDLKSIRLLGDISSIGHMEREADCLWHAYHKRGGLIRVGLGVRISGSRLVRLARRVLNEP